MPCSVCLIFFHLCIVREILRIVKQVHVRNICTYVQMRVDGRRSWIEGLRLDRECICKSTYVRIHAPSKDLVVAFVYCTFNNRGGDWAFLSKFQVKIKVRPLRAEKAATFWTCPSRRSFLADKDWPISIIGNWKKNTRFTARGVEVVLVASGMTQ